MASKREELKIVVEADDNASSVISDVAEKVEKLDGETAEIELTAEDKATDDIKTLMERIETLTDDQKKIVLTAEATKADRTIRQTLIALGKVDGEKATAVLDAKDQAEAKVKAVQDQLDILDRKRATPEIDADTSPLSGKMDEFDGQARSVTANFAGNLAGEMPGIASSFGPLNMAIGQFAEYAAEGDIKLRDMGKALGPMVAMGAAAFAISAGVAAYNAKADKTDEVTQAASDALTTLYGVLDKVKEGLSEAALETGNFNDAVSFSILESFDEGEMQKVSTALADLGLTYEDLGESIRKLEDDNYEATGSFEGMSDILRNSGVNEYTDEIARAVHQGEDFDAIVAHLTQNLINSGMGADEARAMTEHLTSAYGDQINAAEQLNDTQQNTDYAELAEKQLDLARAADEATAAFLNEWEAAHPNGSAADEWQALREHQLELGVSLDKVAGAYEAIKGPAYDAEQATEDAAIAAEEAAQAYRDELTASLEEATEALEENIDALDDQADALRASVDAQYALDKATDEAAEKLTAYNEAVEEHGEQSAEATKALDSYRDSVIDAVDAEMKLLDETNKANGVSQTRVQRLNAENAAYMAQAAAVTGPARNAILSHVAAINGIPAERVTDILTDADPNDIAQVERELAGLTKARTTAIQADWSEASAAVVRAQATAVAKGKTVTFTGNPDFAKVWNAVASLKNQRINFSGNLKGRATGDPNWEGGEVLVGEDGPEVLDLPMGTEITPNHALDTIGRSGGDTINNYVTMNMPAGVRSDDTAAAMRRQLSIQGPY